MDEKELKTSTKQRIVIIVIAILMLGSMIAGYAMIILNGSKGSTGDTGDLEIDEEKIAKYEAAYLEKEAELKAAAKGDFDEFVAFKSEIAAYNETAANSGGVQVEDLKVGSGRALESGDTDYLAYYVGWCADESIFDSSFDDDTHPTAFAKILDASLGMIEGWNMGVEGMKLDGIRLITIPGELAYGDSMEICGGYNKPLKFLVMAKANEGELKTISTELNEAYMRLQYAQYGIDVEQGA